MTPNVLPRGNFNFPVPYRIGAGRRAELGDACDELALARPLVVTDPGVRGLPWFGEVLAAVKRRFGGAGVFDEVRGNPVGANVEAGVAAYLRGQHDGLMLIGGGSALDVGKCIALMARNPGSVFDYEDIGDHWKAADPRVIPPIIAMPTTAGTGSEVGRAAVVLDERDHAKKIIFHPKMQPSLVIADPEVTLQLPAKLTAATGMDALAHAFEALCAPGYHPMADGIALEGIRLVHENLRRCVSDGDDVVARTHMMMAASMGATAFQKGLGLVHALSHPLGGATNIHHGLANAVFMPYVMMFNRDAIADKMVVLTRHLGLDDSGFDCALQWMIDLRHDLGIPHTLAEACSFQPHMAKTLAPLAARDPSLGTNPRPASLNELEQVFIRAFEGDLSAS